MISCLRGFGRGNGLQSEPKIGRNDAVSVEMSIGYITQVLFALAALNVELIWLRLAITSWIYLGIGGYQIRYSVNRRCM